MLKIITQGEMSTSDNILPLERIAVFASLLTCVCWHRRVRGNMSIIMVWYVKTCLPHHGMDSERALGPSNCIACLSESRRALAPKNSWLTIKALHIISNLWISLSQGQTTLFDLVFPLRPFCFQVLLFILFYQGGMPSWSSHRRRRIRSPLSFSIINGALRQ